MSVTYSPDQWRELSRRILVSWGAPEEVAACVAQSLVDSDLAGISSHGLIRIPQYHSFLQAGWLNPAGRAEVVRESTAMAVVDGHWGFGQPVAHRAMDLAMDKARLHGIAAVAIVNSGHIGRLGEYVEKAAGAGMIGMIAASGGPPGGLVVPFGGAQCVLSTNPIAAGAPAREHPPFVMDFATSQVAAGKIELAPDQDMPIPEGWAVDCEGRPATTPRQFLAGGGLLPFGGHKGYALGMLVELLCGALTGAGCSERPDRVPDWGRGGNAAFAVAIDVAHFTDPDVYYAEVDGFFSRLKSVKPAPGSAGVFIPGEPELRQRALRAKQGISIDDAIWQEIAAIAAAHAVTLDDIL
jgi:uncharacterized oxidoreductase